MSNTRYYDLSGIAYWVKHRQPDPEYDNYSVQLVLDEESFDKFRESGMQMEPKQNDKGETFVTFRRPAKKIINGELVNFGAPDSEDAQGNDLSDTIIGNGSEVTINVCVYDTRRGKGHRWQNIKVNNLVPYVSTKEPVKEEAPASKRKRP